VLSIFLLLKIQYAFYFYKSSQLSEPHLISLMTKPLLPPYFKFCLFFIGILLSVPLGKSNNPPLFLFDKDTQSVQAFDTFQTGLKQKMKLATDLYQQQAFEKAQLELVALQRQLLVWQENSIPMHENNLLWLMLQETYLNLTIISFARHHFTHTITSANYAISQAQFNQASFPNPSSFFRRLAYLFHLKHKAKNALGQLDSDYVSLNNSVQNLIHLVYFLDPTEEDQSALLSHHFELIELYSQQSLLELATQHQQSVSILFKIEDVKGYEKL
jgi:hypothetical protein